jgi:hypothetical protein
VHHLTLIRCVAELDGPPMDHYESVTHMRRFRVTHSQLVEVAAAWLRKSCSVVVTELATTGEEPDAIGWQGTFSTLVECKASREDFRADADKCFRVSPCLGIGQHRYFMAAAGVIQVSELPPGWGLLEVTGARIRTLRKSDAFEANHPQEKRILLSCLRRIGHTAPTGMSIRCYTIETQNRATLGIQAVPLPLTLSGGAVV